MLNPKKIEIPSARTYKLETIWKVSESLGFPQWGRRTVLVAGTNGKGSVCAYLTALMRTSGLKVGTYSSPHVVHRTERIRINGNPIQEALLRRYEKRYDKALEPLTYFERMTILAFLIFRDQGVGIQILEVGMGGRLDATNISDPDVSAITRIDYDHQEVLGSTLSLIATEKSGIMRPGRACVTGSQVPEARRQIQKESKRVQSSLKVAKLEDFRAGERAILKEIERERGAHQFQNAMIALRTFQCCQDLWPSLKTLSAAKLKSCLSSKVLWPARLQVVRKKPLILVDGSHNQNSIDAFVSYWKKHHRALKHVQCIFGVMKDKEVEGMLKKIVPLVTSFHLPSFYSERELAPKSLATKILAINSRVSVKTYTSAKICLADVLKEARKHKRPIIALGSLYLAGSILGLMKGRRL